MPWVALFLGLLANVGSNVAFRIAMKGRGGGAGDMLGALLNPALWIGVCLAGFLLLCYLYAIRTLPVALAYPVITGGAMVGIAVSAWLVLSEPLPMRAILGIAATMVGIGLIASAGFMPGAGTR